MIPGHCGISRRAVLKMMAAAGASTATVSQWPRSASPASRLVVGAAYVWPNDDYRWNQGHAHGVTAAQKIDRVNIVEDAHIANIIKLLQHEGMIIHLAIEG